MIWMVFFDLGDSVILHYGRHIQKLSIAGGWAVHRYGRLKSGKKTSELWVVEGEGPVRSFRSACVRVQLLGTRGRESTVINTGGAEGPS